MVAMILSLGKEDTAYEERLAEIVDAMQKFIYDNFNFRVAVLAGEPHNGLEECICPGWSKGSGGIVSVLDQTSSATGKSATAPIKSTIIPPSRRNASSRR